MRRYSLAHLTVLGCAPPEAIRIGRRCGYDMVGLRTIPLGLSGEPRYLLHEDAALFAATRSALDETGIELNDIEDAILGEDRDPAAYLPAMQAGAELGARHLICNAWSGSDDEIQDQFNLLCDLAAPLGLTVQCEFVTFTRIPGLAEARRVVERSGRANAAILIDALHFARSRVSLDELEATPRELLHFIHLDDGPPATDPTLDEMRTTARSARLYPGEGVAPIREIVAHAPAATLAIEVTHSQRIAELGYEGFAAECLKRARRLLDG